MSKESTEGCSYLILGLAAIGLLYWLIVNYVWPLVQYLWLHGSSVLIIVFLALGGYRAVVNYATAFKKNVQFEKP
ncbi:MAG: hypothetical protein KDB00_13380 [Planctomycetales bacterium]|nr:hypothetical protein [Planctomycetales bacterium]